MLSEIQEEYLQWLLTPSGLRQPSDKKAFSEYAGVSRQALYRWEKVPAFRRAFSEAQRNLGISWFADVTARVKAIIDDPDAQARDVIGAARLLLPLLSVEDSASVEDENLDEDAIMDVALKILKSRGE